MAYLREWSWFSFFEKISGIAVFSGDFSVLVREGLWTEERDRNF